MDQICIRGLEVFAHHGVFQEENVLGQKFVVDATLHVDTRQAGQTDELTASVHYGEVCAYICEQMAKQKDKLLERVAERIAEGILLHFPLIQTVELELKKPWAPVLVHVDYCSVKIVRGWHKIYIGAGSNLGDRRGYLAYAKEQLEACKEIRNLRMATVIETEPYGYTDQDTFCNTVFEAQTLWTPRELLDALMAIEQGADRKREIHWGPRTLDLDVLLYDNVVSEDPVVVIPHPDMENRQFVLEPLCELNPYGVHPLLNIRYCQLLKRLLDR